MWGLLGERGNWMGLRDSLFSWGSVWQSLCPALGSSLMTAILVRPTSGSFSPGPPSGAGFSLSSFGRALPTSPHLPAITWKCPFIPTGIFHSVHLDSTCPCPKLQSHPEVVPLQTETHPFLLTFAHAVLEGGDLWPNLPLNVRTTLWISLDTD